MSIPVDELMRVTARLTPVDLPAEEIAGGKEGNARQVERLDVRVDARMRRREGKAATVTILDLSTQGFRAESWIAHPVGKQLWLTLPGLESVLATVRWTDGVQIGCAFERPLHSAVVERFVEADALSPGKA